MMVFLIFLLVTKSKKSGVREKEEESAAAGPAPDTGPAVHTEAISTPEQEYIPPSAPGAEEAGYSDQYMVGQEVVDAELVREDPEQYMQLQGAPGQQEALPPAATPLCPNCGQHSEYYPEYECYWCEPCQSYVNAEEGETTVAGQAETGSVEQGAPVTQAVAANQGVPVTQAVTADQGVPVTQAVAPEQGGIPGGEQVSGALETPLTEGEVEDGEGEPGSTEQSLPSW